MCFNLSPYFKYVDVNCNLFFLCSYAVNSIRVYIFVVEDFISPDYYTIYENVF
jgi:hypothetical protein